MDDNSNKDNYPTASIAKEGLPRQFEEEREACLLRIVLLHLFDPSFEARVIQVVWLPCSVHGVAELFTELHHLADAVGLVRLGGGLTALFRPLQIQEERQIRVPFPLRP